MAATPRPAFDPLERRVLLSAALTVGSAGRVPWAVPPVIASATAAGPVVSSLTLINADTDLPMAGQPTLTNGVTLDLSKLPTKRINVRADASPATKSVRFAYDGNSNYRLENTAPFALAPNDGPDYSAWTPAVGTHTIKVTPYAQVKAGGTAGPTLTVTFKVVAGTTAPSPTVTVSATDATAKEPGTDTGTITVARSGPTAKALTVTLAVAGTATEGADYAPLTRGLTIPAGSGSAKLTVKAVNDSQYEPTETVVVTVAPGAGYTTASGSSSATVTIADDDPPTAQSPFLGSPFVVPSADAIQAEDFDLGGPGIAYQFPAALARANDYRPGVLPPIATLAAPPGGFALDRVPASSGFEYTADVATAGLYQLTVAYAAAGGAGWTAHLGVDDVNASGPLTLASTGRWDQWSTAAIPVALSAGRHVLTLAVDAAAPAAGGPAADGVPVASFDWFALAPPPPTDPSPLPAGSLAAPTGLVAAAAGSTGLTLSWASPPADAAAPAAYRVSYAVGAYVPGAAGRRQVVTLPSTATSVVLSGLQPFSLYSIDVAALDAAGGGTAAHVNAYTAKPADLKRYLYLFDLPKEKDGFRTLKPQIEVFDVDNGHQWVKNIPLPGGIYNVRGIAASSATGKAYVSYLTNKYEGDYPGGLLCLDLNTGKVLWRKDYPASVIPSPDRFDVTPDGAKLYVPAGENGNVNYWVVVDATSGAVLGKVVHVTSPHNTIVSVDGRYAFLEGQEKGTNQAAGVTHTIGVVDTTTDQVVGTVGPFLSPVRPFTVNGKASLVFATVNEFVGFQVGDVATGKVLYTVAPPGYVQPAQTGAFRSLSHGIALTPDERQVWVVDGLKAGIHVFDVSALPAGPPTYVGFIPVRKFKRNLQGVVVPEASNDASGTPAWLAVSHDGKYVYAEGGEIIDVASRKVVGQLRAKTVDAAGNTVWAPYSHSRFMMEVDFRDGKVVETTDQFGLGLVR